MYNNGDFTFSGPVNVSSVGGSKFATMMAAMILNENTPVLAISQANDVAAQNVGTSPIGSPVKGR